MAIISANNLQRTRSKSAASADDRKTRHEPLGGRPSSALAAITTITAGKRGSNGNHFLEFLAVLTLCAGLGFSKVRERSRFSVSALITVVTTISLAWFAMHKWLEDFAYRIGISWWVFVAAGIIAAIIAFVTISFQAIKAATSNPVKNLRTE